MEEMVKAFERNHIGIAGTLETQHDETNVFSLGAALQVIETAVEFRGSAKEQFALQIVEHHGGARPVLGKGFAHDAVAAHDQLVPTEQRSARNKHQNRQSDANEDGEFNTDADGRESRDQNQSGVVAGGPHGIAQALPIDQPDGSYQQ